jgi:hypothetical protein
VDPRRLSKEEGTKLTKIYVAHLSFVMTNLPEDVELVVTFEKLT